ncbi:MAG: DNA topoisomerase III [Opitutales bacterium]
MSETSKTLIIAEKPSVAQDISRALGKFKKTDFGYENDEFVISSAVGHLVELFMPEDIDKKAYGFWRLGSLPIIPEKFKLKPISDKRSKERLTTLKKLMGRKDVRQIYNACDAGREGELIFTYIYELANCKKPFSRIWMQSMTNQAIQEAFSNLRDPGEMSGLQDAARSRSEADWLIGINGTRAVTKRMFGRSKGVATVGRVQTPTLSIVLERELAIRNFQPQSFWRIEGQFNISEGSYNGFLQREDKVDKDENSHDKPDRFWNAEDAESLVSRLNEARVAVAIDEKKRTRKSCERLYDLTSLQREANGRYGYSAARTLQIAQSLYEKHKLLTYPRTDSRALPEDYVATVKSTLSQMEGPISDHASMVLKNDWVTFNKRIFNNAQVSDHFAIIPTGESPKRLSPEEERIFEMVCQRFVAIFFPPAEFDVTTRTTVVAGLNFKTEGKVLVEPGFLQVYGKAGATSELPALSEADKNPAWLTGETTAEPGAYKARPTAIELHQEETKPPAHFTEATLLSAMEGAGKLVEDEDLADAMKEKGLGTPATRANVIDHLIREKYMERDRRNLLVTAKAENLFEFLKAVKADALTRPDLTGEWEYRLRHMESKKITRDAFMKGITDLTKTIVDSIKNFDEDLASAPDSSIISPTDNKPMKELLRAYRSQDEELTIYKTIGNRRFSEEEIQNLVQNRVIGPIDGFRSKAGKPYSAIIRLDAMNKVAFDFGDNGNGDGNGNGEEEDLNLAELPVVGTFKESGATVYETPKAYACERSIKGEPGDNFRLSRTMLSKTLPSEEVSRLLEEGKTGLIKGFVSKRTGRPFDAFLILKKGGKIGFEFPPRPPKKAAVKKAADKE